MNEAKEIAEFDKITAGIAEIQEQGNFIPDTSTKDGYEASKRFVLDVTTPTRTKLADAHKTAKAYYLEGGRAIDKKKNEILDLLVDIQKPHLDAYKAKDQQEKERKAKFEQDIQDKIDVIINYRFLPNGSTSKSITDIIDRCGETDTQDGFYHRATDAFNARQESLDILNDSLMQCVAYEAEQAKQAELAELNRIQQAAIDAQQEQMRLQQEEMDRKQAEIEAAQNEIAEKSRIEAEAKQKLIDDKNRAKEEAKAKAEREDYARQQSEIAAENARQAEIKRQQDEAEAKRIAQEKIEANKQHTSKVRGEIKNHLIDTCGLDNATATKVVKALLTTDRVTINY